MNELSGLNAHRTLAPASPRQPSKQMMWGGQVSLVRRERFCAANTREIVTMAGQKILFSGRATPVNTSSWDDGSKNANNGKTIIAKTHAASGMSAHLSLSTAKNRGRPEAPEYLEDWDLLASMSDEPRRLNILAGEGYDPPRLSNASDFFD
jgi:hypothetical protein